LVQRDVELSGQVVTACLGGLPDRLCNHTFATGFLYELLREIEQSDIDRGLADENDYERRTDVTHTVKVDRDGTVHSFYLDYIYRPAGLEDVSVYDYLMYFEKVPIGDLKSGAVRVPC